MRKLLIKLAFTVALLLLARDIRAEEIIVIVNESGPLAGISQAEISDIYLGNLRFFNGTKIVPINYREGEIKETFLSSITGMSSKDYRRYWITKSFQEGLSLPPSKASFEEIIASVGTIPSAIAYIPRSELKSAKGLRVIASLKE